MTAEPSMEEILSSIKRIIAEDGDGQVRQRRPPSRAATPAAPAPAQTPMPEEVLELSEPIVAPAAPIAAPDVAAEAPRAAAPQRADSLLSSETAAASRGSLAALSKLVVKPEADGDGTLEGLVRGMLRPMLREWLDANLPELVEAMVAREIAKITGQPE